MSATSSVLHDPFDIGTVPCDGRYEYEPKIKAPHGNGGASTNTQISSLISVAKQDAIAQHNATLLDSIANHIRQYVFIRESVLYKLIALWIIATYLHDCFEYMGYLFVHSPERECGKTTLLKHLSSLVYNSTGIQCSPTEAVLFRTAKGHTQILDEGDEWGNIDSLRRVLNSGFQRDGIVQRCEQSPDGGYGVENYPVYCPKVLAGIGRDIFKETTKARTLVIELVRKTQNEKTKRTRSAVVPGVTDLKKEIENWVNVHKRRVIDEYGRLSDGTFTYLEHFTSRTQDIAEPLAVILEIIFENDPVRLREERACLAQAIALCREESNLYSENVQILTALKRLVEQSNCAELIEQSSILAQQIAAQGCLVSDASVSRVLRDFGFKSKSHRKDVGPRSCYVIGYDQISEMVERYCNRSVSGSTDA